MRRFEVMMSADFPSELNGLFKGLESKGNPWNMSPRGRMDWAKDLPFSVPVVGEDVEDLSEVEYLFWVGCAGRTKIAPRRPPAPSQSCLHMPRELTPYWATRDCTGDPAAAGNEFVSAAACRTRRTLTAEAKRPRHRRPAQHCLNALKNEYPQLGSPARWCHTPAVNRWYAEAG
jgi:Fe-S oxidoreductase